MRPAYLAFLATAIATHALVGCVIGERLFDSPVAGAAGGVLADVDFLFPAAAGWPFVHRGLTHSLLLAVLVAGSVPIARRLVGGTFAFHGSSRGAASGQSSAAAVGLAYLSHLAMDATTPKGVPLLHPVSDHGFHLGLPVGAHAPLPTLAIWIACLGILYRGGAIGSPSDLVPPIRGE
jgi:inner membrane protein